MRLEAVGREEKLFLPHVSGLHPQASTPFGPAAPRCILSDSDRCVPDMDSDDDDVVTVSTRLRIWKQRVRLPHHRRLERVGSSGRESVLHEARGRRAYVGSATGWFAKWEGLREINLQTRPSGGSMNEHHVVRGYRGGDWRLENETLARPSCAGCHFTSTDQTLSYPLLKQHSVFLPVIRKRSAF